LSTAFRRLTKEELGFEISINDAKLLGPYDHLYSDSVLGSHISTHYVAIAYQVTVANLINLPKQQHSAYQWLSIEELILSADVHENTKAYFTSRR
jgi:colanic acid biosynthesis protein WcaH